MTDKRIEMMVNDYAERMVKNNVVTCLSPMFNGEHGEHAALAKVLNVDVEDLFRLYNGARCELCYGSGNARYCDEECYECGGSGSRGEALEYWLVEDGLAERLDAKGEAVIETSIGCIWGRTCSGQALYVDGVFQELAVDGVFQELALEYVKKER